MNPDRRRVRRVSCSHTHTQSKEAHPHTHTHSLPQFTVGNVLGCHLRVQVQVVITNSTTNLLLGNLPFQLSWQVLASLSTMSVRGSDVSRPPSRSRSNKPVSALLARSSTPFSSHTINDNESVSSQPHFHSRKRKRDSPTIALEELLKPAISIRVSSPRLSGLTMILISTLDT